jgi:hypothetical protein
MKKIFAASLFLALGSLAQAALIQCTPSAGQVVGFGGIVPGGVDFTCSPGVGGDPGASDDNVSGDGWNVSAIRLGFVGTSQTTGGGIGITYSVRFNATGPAAMTCVATGTSAGNPAGATAICSDSTAFFDIPDVDEVPSFMVNVTAASALGNPLPLNATASVAYEVQAVQPDEPPPGVPEPSTYAMMAAGLVGFYMVRRRS